MAALKKLKIIVIILMMLTFAVLSKGCALDEVAMASVGTAINNRILVDVGHGGFDGGALGISGAKESEINLEIALRLRDILERRGYEVILTRDSNAALGEDKNADMRSRREIIENSGQVITVSIHQNYFSDESCEGPQVFYALNSEQGKLLAISIQEELNAAANVNSPREAMTGDYYIVKSGSVPAVIVECGFISNVAEEEKLRLPWYQIKLSKAIANGIENYLNKYGGNDGRYTGADTEK